MSPPALPPSVVGCTITGKYIGLDGSLVNGTVTFTASPVSLLDAPDSTIIAPRVITATLSSGTFSIVVPATDEAAVNPHRWTYAVSENFSGGRKYNISAPSGRTVDLSHVAPVPAADGTPIYQGPDGPQGPPGAPGDAVVFVDNGNGSLTIDSLSSMTDVGNGTVSIG